jgi:hypothetical protein
MPELSRFFGIIIRMFAEPSERHHPPHFHAYYQEHVAVFAISPIAFIAGSMPQRQQRLGEVWAELHQDELLADVSLHSNRSGLTRYDYISMTAYLAPSTSSRF